MKIVSWNVAGFRACLKKGFSDFFNMIDADIFCIQEVKATLDEIEFHPEGYELYLYPAEKKGYSGTAVYTKIKPIDVIYGIGIDEYDSEGRVITMEFDEFYLVNQYVPNAKKDLSRLNDRMDYEDDVRNYFKILEEKKPVIICGDFNVAHEEIDIKNAKANIGNAGFTYEERDKFSELLKSGFIDTFRYFNKDKEGCYTWWSYMYNARSNNAGWRIDYFVVSKDFIDNVNNSLVHSDILGSDHCPIELDIN